VTKEISCSGTFSALTKTNYTKDRMALEVLTKAVSSELMGTIAYKATAKAT
jgi:hypothetical protein